MIVEINEFVGRGRLETDVCIIGGGTAGITLARELIGQPFRVCLLESGGAQPDPVTNALGMGANIGLPYYPLDTARARFYGGSSTRWHVAMGGDQVGARMRPFDPIDFERRDWVPYSGWPFDAAYLRPYYDRAQAVCRILPETFDVADWEDGRQRPRLPLTDPDVQTVIYKIASRDPFVRDYLEELNGASNTTVVLHANVLEIATNDNGDGISHLRVATLDRKEISVSARLFVLATGGIEVPRMLLLSNRRHASGLGNQNDLVGRFFMEHPHFWSGIFVPADNGLFQRTMLYNDVHTVNGVAIVGKLALAEAALRRERLLNQNIQIIPRMVADPFKRHGPQPPAVEALRQLYRAARGRARLEEPARVVRTVLGGWDDLLGALGRRVYRRWFGIPKIPVFIFANMTEQVPDPESQISLGEELDRFGQRRAQLDWRISRSDVRSAIRTQQLIAGAMEQAGLGRFFAELDGDGPPAGLHGGYHHMGTTRMHPDPKQGVVDEHGRVHGLGNLFIAGPSVFPTVGYANPVLTMLALTLRLADRIQDLMVQSATLGELGGTALRA